MSAVLSTNESPQALTVKVSIPDPLPAQTILFKMPPSTQARVMNYNLRVFSALNGVLFSSVSMHDETGALIFAAGLAPITNIMVFGQATATALAGPEQARVPFFTPNVLLGTIPKDFYALPGYDFRFNALGAVAGRSAEVTIFLSTGNE